MKIATVCTGIGSPDLAADRLGWEHVFMSEIDPHASTVLAHRFPGVPNLGDMTKIDGRDYRGKIDILVGGTPCQNFSTNGNRQGLQGKKSSLAWHYVRLLKEIKPKRFVWENVPGCRTTNGGADLRSLITAFTALGYGVGWRTLDARSFGCPTARERLFVVGYLGDPAGVERVLFDAAGNQRNHRPDGSIGNAIDDRSTDCDPFAAPARDIWAFNGKRSLGGLRRSVAPTFLAMGSDKSWANSGKSIAIVTDELARYLTPSEALRCHGFPSDWCHITDMLGSRRAIIPEGAIYKVVGNSIAVPVIEWIFKRIQEVR
jgi:DNA (cytosine-5)-methyltransferase 1